jgi:hypothetical protein
MRRPALTLHKSMIFVIRVFKALKNWIISFFLLLLQSGLFLNDVDPLLIAQRDVLVHFFWQIWKFTVYVWKAAWSLSPDASVPDQTSPSYPTNFWYSRPLLAWVLGRCYSKWPEGIKGFWANKLWLCLFRKPLVKYWFMGRVVWSDCLLIWGRPVAFVDK